MRRLFLFIFATMLAGQAWAQDFESDGLFYTITSNSEPYSVEVSGGKASLTEVNIPDSVKYESIVYAVTGIGREAFGRNKKIISLNIGNCVTYIGFGAFEYCENLEIVVISNSVTYIGYDAFHCCAHLETIDIPNSVKEIGESAFLVCVALASVTIPDSITTIGYEVFGACRSLQSIIIPNFVTSISRYAFDGCSGLTSITIPESVTNISGYAFANCENLVNVVCMPVLPPIIDKDPFTMADIIYVPEEAVNDYKSAEIWKFKEIKPFYTITTKSTNELFGTVQGDSLLLEDKPLTINALPKSGYHFVKWSDGNTDNPRTYSTAKDTSFTAIFEAHSTVTDEAVAATCTATGLTEGSHCSVCNTVLVAQTEIPMAEHTAVVDIAIAATCTESGLTEGSHCSVCNATIVAQKEIPALGHEFKNYVYNNDATTEVNGTETAVCEHGCGVTDTRVKEGTKLATAVSESAANAINIYAIGSTIVIENATEEIFVYDAMGALVGRDAINRVRTEIPVNGAGVYIVKTGGVVKRVVVY